jgi:hypothetical protein
LRLASPFGSIILRLSCRRLGKAVLFKLSRLLFDEIRELETLAHYKSARILGLCLNVMDLKIGDKKGYGSEEFPLRKTVLNWTKKNYLKLVEAQPEVAAACLAGVRRSYDPRTSNPTTKLIDATYTAGTSLEGLVLLRRATCSYGCCLPKPDYNASKPQVARYADRRSASFRLP